MEPDSKIEISSEITLVDLPGDELLALWKSGNEGAATVLVDRYCLRLVALVATKMNQRFRDTVDPEDVVQSAMGSFFRAARQSKLEVSRSASLWQLLATFAKRKMLRSIERSSAIKRGGEAQRVEIDHGWIAEPSRDQDAKKLMAEIRDGLPIESRVVLDGLILGKSQQEIADEQALNVRTIRRRVSELRAMFAPDQELTEARENEEGGDPTQSFVSVSLPRIHYREFVLGKLVGSGGFGKVYRATLQSGKNVVAVKFLRKRYWQNGDVQKSFLREIDQASRIDHPAVVQHLGWGMSPHGGLYVVTQWVDGTTLSQLMGDDRGVTAERFRDYLIEICYALKVIHESNIVHGDISPNNVLVSKANHIVIVDFGFSQNLNRHREQSPLGGTPLGGTLGFAAAEQVAPSFGKISPKTDVYAVGALAFWYLTGHPPHERETMEESLASTIGESEIENDGFSSDSPASRSLAKVAKACLKNSVSQRPEITAVIDLLDADN